MTTLINSDAVGVLASMADDSVDVIIADPPYGLDIPYASYEDSRDNLKKLLTAIVPHMLRVAKRTVLFPGINNIWLYPPADWMACWFYGTTGSWGKLGYNSWQPLLFYGKNNRRYGLDTIKYSKMEKRVDGHPCSKPLGLMQEVVKRFSDPGETVLDPFMGTGTTGVACEIEGRNFVGVEIDRGYFDMATRRINEVVV